MKKVIYIVGPTASGKTSLALELASKFGGDIISADSRQIYQGMDIGTGKDIPKGFSKKIIDLAGSKYTTYSGDQTTIFGYDLVEPTKDFSIAQFRNNAIKFINHIHHNQRLPIIVGGTGFYLKSIETPPDSISIPQNQTLRNKLINYSLKDLQEHLVKLNSPKFNQLNKSDKNNPRRLIRAIEISKYKLDNPFYKKPKPISLDNLWIGLLPPISNIDKSIEKRVRQRIDQGFEQEFNHLYSEGRINHDLQSTSSTGYKQWLEYKQSHITKDQAIKNWITVEKQYARRQITWFKKQSYIKWFNPKDQKTTSLVVDLTRVWYS